MSKAKHSLLWSINGDGLPGTSYLFGTMHVKDDRAFRHQEKVYGAMDQCDAFATEFNLEEMAQNAGAGIMDLADGQSLAELLPPKAYKKVNKYFQKVTGLELSHFDNAQPILITNLISERILSEDNAMVLDHQLWEYARQQDKILLGIESFEEQMQILAKIPLDYQVKNLTWIAKNFKRFRRQLLKMTELYAEGNLQQLHKSAKKSLKGLRKLLLYDRNYIMAERIGAMIQEQTLCSAIGAGHLGGKKGVLRLLKQQGLVVKPV